MRQTARYPLRAILSAENCHRATADWQCAVGTIVPKESGKTIRTNNTLTAVLDFIYDESGKPFALKYSTDGTSFATYYYVLNDNETGLYYLRSRYYDPENHRFINADTKASTGQGFVGTNLQEPVL